eukprot:63986-Rhodomonas_salina.2
MLPLHHVTCDTTLTRAEPLLPPPSSSTPPNPYPLPRSHPSSSAAPSSHHRSSCSVSACTWAGFLRADAVDAVLLVDLAEGARVAVPEDRAELPRRPCSLRPNGCQCRMTPIGTLTTRLSMPDNPNRNPPTRIGTPPKTR